MTDGLEYLRIPYEKIKFGKKLEVQGYGFAFQGEIDGQRVLLKQPNITNLGNIRQKLLAEILTVSRFRHHPNLVALLGFCDEKSNEIILVYEYVSGGNLADKMRKRLTTIQRLEICLGVARGLDYLHTGIDASTPGIVHGDIRLSEILLHSDLNSSKVEAKLSSYGLSKIMPGQARKLDEVIEGPTMKSDVYAFGVVLLEVMCGVLELIDTEDYQRQHVTKLVPKKLEQKKLQGILHFDIKKEIKAYSLETYATIACRCVLENGEERPSMAQVVKELEKALILQGGEVSDGARVIAPPKDGSVDRVDSELDAAGEDDAGSESTTGDRKEMQPEEVSMLEAICELQQGKWEGELMSYVLYLQMKEGNDELRVNTKRLEHKMRLNIQKVHRLSGQLHDVGDELSKLKAHQLVNEKLSEQLYQRFQEQDHEVVVLHGVLIELMNADLGHIEMINTLKSRLRNYD